MSELDKMTSREYWEGFHCAEPRLRLPSKLVVATRNMQDLFDIYVNDGMSVLEIGFAPGKHLAYLSSKKGAVVSGLDYSENGVKTANKLFDALGLDRDLRCEDVFESSFENDSFDFIYSVGVIEHFTDPRNIVKRHVDLLKPGGTSLILIPNYRGIYGRLQKYFYPQNLDIHNLEIMTKNNLLELAPEEYRKKSRTFSVGRIDPSQLTPINRWSKTASKIFYMSLTLLGHLQPFKVDYLSPWLALEIKKIN